ncbi:MAG TPA: amidohydrolase [Gammaproteobacteria bacterium]|nr:amidohydrolase [Gammaproteobacteria bacterium]|tara:strand:- start:39 stop:1181 length:1143 start_codon:yes stop_codon:yes gene_type:complete
MKTYKNLTIWDGCSDEMREGDLSVANGKFVLDPANGRNFSGCFAIPGLIDAHVHLCLDPDISDPLKQTEADTESIKQDIRDRALAMVKVGITSARDLGGGQWLELEIRDEIARGRTLGPRLVCAGQPITSVGGHCHFWGGEAIDTDAAITVLQRQLEHDVDLIKIMITGGTITPGSKPIDSQFEDETVSKIVMMSNAADRHVAGHCHGTDGIRQAAKAGIRTVEHCSWVGETGWGRDFNEKVVDAMVANNVWVSPTINAGWRRFQKPEFVEIVRSNYRKMKQAGIKLIASTDAGIPKVYHHDLPRALLEFARFAELTPLETLKAATSDCATAIDLGDVTGQIKPGYSADFVVYESNPLENLEALQHPVLVVVKGEEVLPA